VAKIEAVSLSKQITEQIDHWLAKYPADQRRSAVLPALHIVQDEHGYLTKTLIQAVADYLRIPAIQVYEAATFYSMYDHKPAGKHKINVCTNISCKLRNSAKIMNHLQAKLGIKPGEVTADGKFGLKEVECLGACVGAPMMQVNKDYHENLTPERVDEILDGLE